MLNVVVLRGVLSRPAEERALPSGSRLVAIELTIRRDDAPAEGVPVAWFDPPASAGGLDVGDEVWVVGRVRRRFFRTGGGTQSRTEVVAAEVLAARRTKRAIHAVEEVAATILQLVTPPGG